MLSKTGILLINLGTPDAPTRGAVYKYLKEFLLDERVIDINPIARNLLVRGIIAPFRSGQSAKGYQLLWTPEGSPLKTYGYKLAEAVQAQLGDNYMVELGMRYQSPSLESVLEKFKQARVSELIIFPLFPQYASASTGSAHQEVMRILSTWQVIPKVQMISSYPSHPAFINAWVAKAKSYNWQDYDHVLFSYHGIPQRQMRKASTCNHCLSTPDCCQTWTDRNEYCYSAQCYETTRALVQALNIPKEKYSVCFQSRLGRDPWIQPYTSDMLKTRAAAGDKNLLVFCPAFTSDCLETVVEVSMEYAEEFEEMGGKHVQLVESLNDSPEWVDAVVEMLKNPSLAF
jgi:ferrochelatase